jgi:hypothetical protein
MTRYAVLDRDGRFIGEVVAPTRREAARIAREAGYPIGQRYRLERKRPVSPLQPGRFR